MCGSNLGLRLSGPLCLVLAFILTGLLSRGEPFAPLILAGLALVALSEEWKNLKLRRHPVAIRGEKALTRSMKLLAIGVVSLLFSASVGTALRTGFSPVYAFLLIGGMGLILAGILLGGWGMSAARRSLRTALEQ